MEVTSALKSAIDKAVLDLSKSYDIVNDVKHEVVRIFAGKNVVLIPYATIADVRVGTSGTSKTVLESYLKDSVVMDGWVK